jgi:hypothetical protein
MNNKRMLLVVVFIGIQLLLAGVYFRGQVAGAFPLGGPQSTPVTPPPDVEPPGGPVRPLPGGPAAGIFSVDQAGRPATPDLIEAAYQRGEIDAAGRILYLAYAVYEYRSLPAQFHSKTPWWGTNVVAEVKAAAAEIDSGFGLLVSPQVRSEIQRLLTPQAATVCDKQDAANNSDSTNFHVNYGTFGGGLSLSDYTTALETTFGTEVTSYGWAKPPVCTTAACGTDNPWDRYPVQVAGLGGGLYGYVTSSGGIYTGDIGNNPNTPAAETDSVASCMVLNSDYTGFPGGALLSLQVTAAHEFVHSIQFGYGDPSPFEDDIWYESIAAYMEDEVYDAVNDNYQYLYPTFTSCLGEYSGNVYSDWLFYRYAAERTGGTNLAGGGEDVAQGYWANVSLGQTGLGAYNNALAAKGANLNDIFHNYAITSRFMKSCPGSSPYCFEEAAGYVAAEGTPANQGSIASAPGSYTGSVSNHYALNWVGLPATGTYTVTLSNNSASSGVLRGSVVANTPGGLVVTAIPGLANASGTIRLSAYSVPAGATSVAAVITNQQKTADNPASCTDASYTVSLNPGGGIVGDNKLYVPLVTKQAFTLSGRVNQNNAPVAGSEVLLRYYDGVTWSTYLTQTTNVGGAYSFVVPPLDGAKKYYVRWENQNNDLARLYTWNCNEITASGGNTACSFDIQNVYLTAPADGTTTTLPRTFSWTPRGITGDSYQWRLYDLTTDLPYFETPLLGAAGSYLLNFLPTGFSPTGVYGWDVVVRNSAGYGISQQLWLLNFAVTVTPSGANTLLNSGFESGRGVSWQEYSSNGWNLVVNSGLPEYITPHGGSWLAWLGGDLDETSRLNQQVTIPATNPMLRFWYWIDSVDICGYDSFYVVITTGGQNIAITEFELCSANDTGGWQQATVSLRQYAGQTVTVQFWVETDSSENSNFFVDDTWLGATGLTVVQAPFSEVSPPPETTPAGEPKTR